MRQALINTLKLACAGASIFAIGALMLATSPQRGEVVAEAQADIGDVFSQLAVPKNAFSRLMDDFGLRPRAYDYNGNVIFFGAASTRAQPQEGLRELQQRFVERGINKEMHLESLSQRGMAQDLSPEKLGEMYIALRGEGTFTRGPEYRPEGTKIAEDFLNGEIIPIHNTPGYVSMSGIVPKRRGVQVTSTNLYETWEKNDHGALDPRDNSDGFRFVDLTRESDNTTTMTAVWADADFNAHKLDPDYDGPGLSVDREIPSCIGCVRTSRIESLDGKRDPFTTNQFYSPIQREEVSHFYQRSMEGRGWRVSRSQELLNKLFEENPHLAKRPGEALILERGNERINLLMHENPAGGTHVTTLHERDQK